MEGFTPGPWVFDERGGCVAVYHGDKRNCLAGAADSCIFYRGGTRHYKKPQSLWESLPGARLPFTHWSVDPADVANARLIAAAPDLLRALWELMNAVGDMPADPSECWPEEWEAATAARRRAVED